MPLTLTDHDTIENLNTLELKPDDLASLTEEEQNEKIRRKWIALCLKHHPDKNRDNQEAVDRFHSITDAYNALVIQKQNYRPEINDYFAKAPVTIPDTAFDFLIQEGIETTCADLLRQFSSLETVEEKQAFGQHYASFLNLAQSLEAVQERLNKERVEYLFARQNEMLVDRLTREWRTLIIRLFAEEYLDDFQYRHALATGELWPVLSTIKLASPVKLVVALLNSVIMVICTTAIYMHQQIMLNIFKDFIALKHGSELRIKQAAILALKISGVLLLFLLPFHFIPEIALFVFCLPMIAKILELCASPVNNIIRPLATSLGCSPIAMSALCLSAATALVYSKILTSLAAFAASLAGFIILGLALYQLYATGKLLHNMYKKSPDLAIFSGLFLAGNLVLNWLIPEAPVAENTVNLIAVLLTELTGCSVLYYVNNMLENSAEAAAREIEELPLPREPVPREIIDATLTGYKTANLSHRFFNTPKDDEYVMPEDRTLRQQVSCFFGGGRVDRGQQVPPLPVNHATTSYPVLESPVNPC